MSNFTRTPPVHCVHTGSARRWEFWDKPSQEHPEQK